MSLSDRHIRQAAFVVGEELARRGRLGLPIPAVLIELDRALTSELAVCGHGAGGVDSPSPTIESVKQRARRTGRSERTERRYARQSGGRKIGRAWFFET